ncbi:MAG TPA: DMT family transporter [Clostridiaceae bacterium]|nr:DMT family transporter [Clostridiaceae bacterium]
MSKHLKADLSLLLATAIWGSSFTLIKNVIDHIPTFAYLSLRFIIASIILIAVFYKKLKYINKKAVIYGCIIGLMLFGGMALQVSGLYFTSASNSAFITGLNVIMVPLFSSAILKKKPDRSSVIGVILAFAGLFFLTGGLDFRFNIGDFLTLLCAVCFALQIIFIDRYNKEQDPIILTLIQISFTALLNTVVWLFIDYKPVVINANVAFTLFATAVLGTAIAYLIQTVAQKHTTPTHTALIFTAEPVFAAFFAMIIPNSNGTVESLSLNTIIGCALILAGTLICELRK